MKEKIIRILTEIRPEFDFTMHSNFIEEGMLDSFDVVQLVASIETEFDISIEGIDIVPANFSSIEKIQELVTKYGVQ